MNVTFNLSATHRLDTNNPTVALLCQQFHLLRHVEAGSSVQVEITLVGAKAFQKWRKSLVSFAIWNLAATIAQVSLPPILIEQLPPFAALLRRSEPTSSRHHAGRIHGKQLRHHRRRQ